MHISIIFLLIGVVTLSWCQVANPRLSPVLDCMENDGTICNAFFGYLNEHTEDLTVEVGFNNKFIPEPRNRGQPITFRASTRAYKVFNVSRS